MTAHTPVSRLRAHPALLAALLTIGCAIPEIVEVGVRTGVSVVGAANAATGDSMLAVPDEWDFDSGPGPVVGLHVLTDGPVSGYLELRSVSVDWEDDFGNSGSEDMTEFAIGFRSYLMDMSTMYGFIPYLGMDIARLSGMEFGSFRGSSGTDVGLTAGLAYRTSPTWSADVQVRLFLGGMDSAETSIGVVGVQYDLAVTWWLGRGDEE